MITAIRAELLKVRTTRLAPGLLALAAGLNGLVATVTSARAGGGGSGFAVPPLNTTAGLRMVLTSGGFGLILAAVFGATVASGEFRHRTATDTYLDEPNRVRVLLAKAVAAAAVGLGFGLVGAAVTTGVGLAFVAVRGYELALPAATIARFAAGAVVGSGLLAAIGVGLGSLIRGQIGATIAVLVWGFGIEQLLGGLSRSVAPYLPYTAAATVAGARSGEGMPQLPSGLSPLPFGAVAALLLGVAVLISTVAAVTTAQRDVS
jgi:ABC-type transport system involved in multi-copper enzyme maturation permease subunit